MKLLKLLQYSNSLVRFSTADTPAKTQLTFTRSKPTIETLEKDSKYVQS